MTMENSGVEKEAPNKKTYHQPKLTTYGSLGTTTKTDANAPPPLDDGITEFEIWGTPS